MDVPSSLPTSSFTQLSYIQLAQWVKKFCCCCYCFLVFVVFSVLFFLALENTQLLASQGKGEKGSIACALFCVVFNISDFQAKRILHQFFMIISSQFCSQLRLASTTQVHSFITNNISVSAVFGQLAGNDPLFDKKKTSQKIKKKTNKREGGFRIKNFQGVIEEIPSEFSRCSVN